MNPRSPSVPGGSPVKLVASRRPAARVDDHGGPSFDRAKKSFLAAISHEMRTPLNAIIGFSEIMDAELLGPIERAEYREYIRDIRTSSRHLLRIIEDVLEISQAEAGELVLAKREVDAAELVSLAIARYDATCLARRISVVPDLANDLVIQVDPPRVERAIMCLLSNAIKFSADRSTIHIRADLGTDQRVRIVIRDHGIGMAPSAIGRAFTPFIQLEDRLSRPYDGAGLGLPLARLLAELHGGTVHIDSRRGEGTTATLEFPAYARGFDDKPGD
jgi:two-component system, cell cycle sensor histidine kinase PleC